MKIEELLKNEAKLNKYKELKEWEDRFMDMVEVPIWHTLIGCHNIVALPLPDHIKKIIINALEAEIAKLDEE